MCFEVEDTSLWLSNGRLFQPYECVVYKTMPFVSIVLVLLFINRSRFVKTSVLNFLIRTKYTIVHQQLKQI